MITSMAIADQAIYGVLLILGLLVCFWGYRLFRFWLFVAGLQAGFFLGLSLGSTLLKNQVLILIVAILSALLIAGLSFALVRLGALFAGAAVVGLVFILLMQLFSVHYSPYVLIAVMVIGGLLGVFSVKPFLVLATAVNGAWLAADSAANLISGHALNDYLTAHQAMKTGTLILLLAGIIVLAIFGTMVQFSNLHKKQQKDLAVKAKQSVVPILPAAGPQPETKPEEPDKPAQ